MDVVFVGYVHNQEEKRSVKACSIIFASSVNILQATNKILQDCLTPHAFCVPYGAIKVGDYY